MIFSAVFLIGFSTLAFEVLLTRIFSIGQWNHLSFMVISIALFGFAASGTLLSILNARHARRPGFLSARKSTATLIVLYTSTTLLSFIVLNNLALDYFRLPVEPIQSFYLLIAFIVLALPFFFSGFIVALAYTRLPEKTGLIYFATMCGSACGAIFPGLLLPVFGEGRLVIYSALVPLILMPVILGRSRSNQPGSRIQKSAKIALGFCSLVILHPREALGLQSHLPGSAISRYAYRKNVYPYQGTHGSCYQPVYPFCSGLESAVHGNDSTPERDVQGR
jgi:MFS family permease